MNRLSSFRWRPTTTVLLIGGFTAVLIALVVAFTVETFRPTTEVRLGSGVYHLWVADTDAELTQGLSGVESLKPNGGLLMKYDQDAMHGIWMKDMKVPLDIVWLDKNKEVIFIVKNALPELGTDRTFSPKEDARYVVELPAGSVDKDAIKSGAVATFDDEREGAR